MGFCGEEGLPWRDITIIRLDIEGELRLDDILCSKCLA
jgi:hypothetical protein